MRFETVFPEARHGRCITRRTWLHQVHVRIAEPFEIPGYPHGGLLIMGPAHEPQPWKASPDDLLAQDWVVMTPEP